MAELSSTLCRAAVADRHARAVTPDQVRCRRNPPARPDRRAPNRRSGRQPRRRHRQQQRNDRDHHAAGRSRRPHRRSGRRRGGAARRYRCPCAASDARGWSAASRHTPRRKSIHTPGAGEPGVADRGVRTDIAARPALVPRLPPQACASPTAACASAPAPGRAPCSSSLRGIEHAVDGAEQPGMARRAARARRRSRHAPRRASRGRARCSVRWPRCRPGPAPTTARRQRLIASGHPVSRSMAMPSSMKLMSE